jgi:hypothetical protein
MKKLITETEKNDIRKMQDLNESWFSDIINKIMKGGITKDLSKAFEDLTGVDFSKKESSGEVSSDYKEFKITEPSSSDKKFYEEVLEGIGAKPTNENLLFLYAWRQAEGAKSTYNPFNTTHKKEGSSLWNCLKKKDGKCVGGVRNYKSEQDGIDATVNTLKNGRYSCIVDGLKNNKGAMKIAECSNLKTWGTGGLIKKVLEKKTINPPSISRTLVKKV